MKYAQLLSILIFLSIGASAQAKADSTLVRETALNYIQGWYTADADRMKKALHPELVKRVINTTTQYLSNASADMMIELASKGIGKRLKGAKGEIDYTLLDYTSQMAMVRLKTLDYIDYLQLGKVNGEWKIINVLWAMRENN